MEAASYEQQIAKAVRDAVRDAVQRRLVEQYNSPFDKILNDCLQASRPQLEGLLVDSIQSAIADVNFRVEIAVAVRHKLAQVLVQRFGGELERQVNALKSDPTTRARITVAIEEVVRTAQAAS